MCSTLWLLGTSGIVAVLCWNVKLFACMSAAVSTPELMCETLIRLLFKSRTNCFTGSNIVRSYCMPYMLYLNGQPGCNEVQSRCKPVLRKGRLIIFHDQPTLICAQKAIKISHQSKVVSGIKSTHIHVLLSCRLGRFWTIEGLSSR